MIIVTGAGGFIGSNIVADLAEAGKGPIVASDYWGTNDKWKNVAQYYISDFVQPQELLDFARGRGDQVSALIHMGAISTTTERDVDKLISQNVNATVALWDHCTSMGIPFIYASSAATYGGLEQNLIDDQSTAALALLRPLNGYGWSKHVTDRILMQRVADGQLTPPQWCGLKFFNVYGPNEYHKNDMQSVVAKFFDDVREQRQVELFQSHRLGIEHGTQARDFIYVKDCTAAVMWMLDNPQVSGLFNIGTGQARSFRDLITAIAKALDMPVEFSFVPMPEHLRDRYQYFTEANMDKLRAAGYNSPFRSVEAGVADYVLNYLATENPYR